MQTAKVLSTADVKKIIAEHFGVDEKNVIPSKYSFTVIDGESKEEE